MDLGGGAIRVRNSTGAQADSHRSSSDVLLVTFLGRYPLLVTWYRSPVVLLCVEANFIGPLFLSSRAFLTNPLVLLLITDISPS